MSKLLERLRDPSRSGVYRTSKPDAILEALRGSGIDLARIDAGRQPLFDAIAKALEFPDWFGRNWDALEDCLSDLSWRPASGHLLLFESFAAGDELGVLIDVLGSAAEYWAGRGRPFFAVFVDPARRLALPDLYRET
jgi:RNAse (barnase) inhibitor barstar